MHLQSPLTGSPRTFMQRALRLARRGVGRASPNPAVGAVVVQGGRIVGQGSHVFAKRQHAEVVALQKAGEKARGADLYVTLEPCTHTGRTPPCVEEIISVGVKTVYVATRDPNPLVNGKGIECLRAAGLEVFEGLCEAQALRLNEPFFHLVHTGRPFVTLKLALSLDGRIAARTGASKWITGLKARRLVHRLRYEHDAILVGSGTLALDDPSLDVRWPSKNSIIKIVLDSDLRTPPQARLFRSGDPVLIFHSRDAPESRVRRLSQQAQLVAVSRASVGLDWVEVLTAAGQRGVNSLLVEGGGAVASSILRARAVQRILLFYASRIIGADGVAPFGSLDVDDPGQAIRVRFSKIRRLGEDFLVEARLE